MSAPHVHVHEGSNSVAADQLRQIVERAEHLNGERKALAEDLADLFKEARGNGFNVAAIKEIIKLRAQDTGKRSEHEAIVELYREALGLA